MNLKIGNTHESKVEYQHNSYITIDQDCYAELTAFVQGFDGECSGCGLVERIQHKDKFEYHIIQVYLPRNQKNTGTATDVDADEVGKIVTSLVRDGKDTSLLRLHWHSHANMSVFHSGTDKENYDDLKTGEFLVSLVANKEGDILGRIDYYEPLRLSFIGVPVYINVELPEVKPEIKQLIDEVKATESRVITYSRYDSRRTTPSVYTGYQSWEIEPVEVPDFHTALELCAVQEMLEVLRSPEGNIVGFKVGGTSYQITLEELTPWEVDNITGKDYKDIKPSNVGCGYDADDYVG